MLLKRLFFLDLEKIGDKKFSKVLDMRNETLFYREDVGLHISGTDVKGDGNIEFKLCGITDEKNPNADNVFACTFKMSAKDFNVPRHLPLSHGGNTMKRFRYFSVQLNKTGVIDGSFLVGLAIGASAPTYV